MKMSVVCPLVLLILGALVHVSCAIQCYSCATKYKEDCDDPLDTTKVQKTTCPSNMNAFDTSKVRKTICPTNMNAFDTSRVQTVSYTHLTLPTKRIV